MGSVIGVINEETPRFDLLHKAPQYEIRRYHPQIRASFSYSASGWGGNGGAGFRPLAGYIFGKNHKRQVPASETISMTAPVYTQPSETIAMTAPVLMDQTSTQKMTMSFVMPSKYKSVQDLPIPDNENVTLEEIPSETYAVIQFNGYIQDALVQEKAQLLRNECKKDEILLDEYPSSMKSAQFNPPWTPSVWRTNEVMIPVVDMGRIPVENNSEL